MRRVRAEAVNGLTVEAGGKRLINIGNKPVRAGEYVWTDGRCVYGFERMPEQPFVPTVADKQEQIIPLVNYHYYGYYSLNGEYTRILEDNGKFDAMLNNRTSAFKFVPKYGEDADLDADGNIYTISNDCRYEVMKSRTIPQPQPIRDPNVYGTATVTIYRNGEVFKTLDFSRYVEHCPFTYSDDYTYCYSSFNSSLRAGYLQVFADGSYCFLLSVFVLKNEYLSNERVGGPRLKTYERRTYLCNNAGINLLSQCGFTEHNDGHGNSSLSFGDVLNGALETFFPLPDDFCFKPLGYVRHRDNNKFGMRFAFFDSSTLQASPLFEINVVWTLMSMFDLVRLKGNSFLLRIRTYGTQLSGGAEASGDMTGGSITSSLEMFDWGWGVILATLDGVQHGAPIEYVDDDILESSGFYLIRPGEPPTFLSRDNGQSYRLRKSKLKKWKQAVKNYSNN